MRILIVHDHSLIRESLVYILKEHFPFTIVGDVGTAEEAVEQSSFLKPDIILMNIELPDFSGLEATRQILSRLPETKVLVLTSHDSDELLFSAISAGAKGFLPNNISVASLIASLHALGRGEVALSRRKVARLLDEYIRLAKQPGREELEIYILTSREQDILRLLAQNASNRQIAKELAISNNTVKVHVHNILKKLNLANRREASRYAHQLGWINMQ